MFGGPIDKVNKIRDFPLFLQAKSILPPCG